MQRIFITGTAGFIGFHLARLLLDEGFTVAGFDGMTDYYDVRLKQRRHQMLLQSPGFRATEAILEDRDTLDGAIDAFAPDVIIHLAAQAGVRYSLENPRAYIDAFPLDRVGEIHLGGHDEDENLVAVQNRCIHHFDLKRLVGLAVTLATDRPSVHFLGHVAHRRDFPDFVEVFFRRFISGDGRGVVECHGGLLAQTTDCRDAESRLLMQHYGWLGNNATLLKHIL